MKPAKLKRDEKYYYTAGEEWETVTYCYEAINGYCFEKDGQKKIVSYSEVISFIEEI